MDAVAPLAAQVVGILAPYLPRLLEAGKNVAESAFEEAESEGRELAKQLWGRLREKLLARPSAKEAVDDLAANPSDEDSRAVLRVQLKRLLSEDQALRDELSSVIEAHQQSTGTTVTASGTRSVAVGGNVQGSTITTGDHITAKDPRSRSR